MRREYAPQRGFVFVARCRNAPLKGLEADSVVVLDPGEIDAAHLYVALTRGSRKLVVCSSSPVLKPHW